MRLEDYPLALTTGQVAEILGVSRQRAWALVRSGAIPGYYLEGKMLRIPRDAIAEWLANGRVISDFPRLSQGSADDRDRASSSDDTDQES